MMWATDSKCRIFRFTKNATNQSTQQIQVISTLFNDNEIQGV